MAVYSRGMTGSYIKKIQQRLNELGFDAGAADGIYGPRTEAAVMAWQKKNDFDANGVVGQKQLTQMGLGPAGAGGVDPAGDYTDAEETRFNALPGKPEIWQDKGTGKAYVVYYVPDTEPPIPILFSVATDEDLKTFFGDSTVKYDKILTMAQIQSAGAMIWGSTDTIPATAGNPWAGFVERMERAKETQPWLADPEVWAVYGAAFIEGREVEKWELESTDWWQTHTEAQQDWMWAIARNPSEAQRILDDNYIAVFAQLRELGYTEPPAELVTYLSTMVSTGDWTTKTLQEQIQALSGAPAAGPIDPGLAEFLTQTGAELGETKFKETDVRDLFARWLGPGFPPSPQQIDEWGARLRHGGAAAEDELIEHLRSQRLALFPTYENANLTYEDIASPWRNFMTTTWGQVPDETDPIFQKLITLNDMAEGGKLLRSEGMKKGVKKVTQEALSGLMDATGGQVRRAL